MYPEIYPCTTGHRSGPVRSGNSDAPLPFGAPCRRYAGPAPRASASGHVRNRSSGWAGVLLLVLLAGLCMLALWALGRLLWKAAKRVVRAARS